MRYAIIDKILDYHTTMAFEFGDTALEKRCLDDANWAYRHVIRTYTGTAYSGSAVVLRRRCREASSIIFDAAAIRHIRAPAATYLPGHVHLVGQPLRLLTAEELHRDLGGFTPRILKEGEIGLLERRPYWKNGSKSRNPTKCSRLEVKRR